MLQCMWLDAACFRSCNDLCSSANACQYGCSYPAGKRIHISCSRADLRKADSTSFCFVSRPTFSLQKQDICDKFDACHQSMQVIMQSIIPRNSQTTLALCSSTVFFQSPFQSANKRRRKGNHTWRQAWHVVAKNLLVDNRGYVLIFDCSPFTGVRQQSCLLWVLRNKVNGIQINNLGRSKSGNLRLGMGLKIDVTKTNIKKNSGPCV